MLDIILSGLALVISAVLIVAYWRRVRHLLRLCGVGERLDILGAEIWSRLGT